MLKKTRNIQVGVIFFATLISCHAQSPVFPKDLKGIIDGTKNSAPPTSQSNVASTQKSQPASTNESKPSDLTKRIILIGALPISAQYTNNDWSVLNENFPSVKFSTGSDKKYTDVKTTKIKSKTTEIDITAKGARSMIISVEATAYRQDGSEYGFREFLNKSMSTKKVCVLDDSASASNIYYEYADGVKPLLIHYEISAGSGGTTESIQLGALSLPKECKAPSEASSNVPTKSANSGSGATQATKNNRSQFPNEFIGSWGIDQKDCSNLLKARQSNQDYFGPGIDFYNDNFMMTEYRCDASSNQRFDGKVFSGQLLCHESGTETKVQYTISLLDQNSISIKKSTGVAEKYIRCKR